MLEFSRVERLTASCFLTKFLKVYSSEMFEEKSSAKVYLGKMFESTQARNFLPVNFPKKLTVNHSLKFGNALRDSWVQQN